MAYPTKPIWAHSAGRESTHADFLQSQEIAVALNEGQASPTPATAAPYPSLLPQDDDVDKFPTPKSEVRRPEGGRRIEVEFYPLHIRRVVIDH